MSCGWLHSVTQGTWLMAPPISKEVHTTVIGCACWVGCIWSVYACQISLEVRRLTGSLMLRILVCCLTDVCFHLQRTCLTVPELSPVSSCRPTHSAGDQQRSSGWLCTVTVHITCRTMASGDDRSSRPEDDRSGVNFHNKLRVSCSRCCGTQRLLRRR